MNARVSGALHEYHAWLDGVEPAWTIFDPARWEALMREPSAGNGALRLATTLFGSRVLRPLWWFGLVDCREQGEDLDDASWRKNALFDRFLTFGTDLVRTVGSLH